MVFGKFQSHEYWTEKLQLWWSLHSVNVELGGNRDIGLPRTVIYHTTCIGIIISDGSAISWKDSCLYIIEQIQLYKYTYIFHYITVCYSTTCCNLLFRIGKEWLLPLLYCLRKLEYSHEVIYRPANEHILFCFGSDCSCWGYPVKPT